MGALWDLLILFEHAYKFTQYHWDLTKEWIRQQLGPSTNITYLIMADASIITTNVEHSNNDPIASYNPTERRIIGTMADAPMKRLPWISIQYTQGENAVVDLSDWLSEIRTNTDISLQTLIRLAFAAQNKYLAETADAKIVTIDRASGEEEEWHYVGNVALRRPPMHHRETLPFDNSGVPIY